ncbi:helix-turn-helix domain-containing protein [Mycolicibacillus parakoreensis]|uniref:Transcriptional regulator n=1 Tax=Mycolicibacillus parakoreensis TaxID=1069221 RepID=A0ABY3TUW4_9MYCO|nr:helix-turn-helix domain-containing protein [Mycolicibacillus parakoreensis]MCV7317181.1 helix-turn-helix domain-containing protein [Mycolicibacillus parakoreensis]ULN51498.1 transcriptional regulator [Mycolicibacillus parakoreensis]
MPDQDGLARDAAGIGALADPLRRRLYAFVCAQPGPVSRDQAADAVGVARHQAKFHLDRLEAEGLLESSYARLTGRTGPGAGRPAKLYRRSARDIAISLPHREYRLAGELMATAIAESAATGAPVRAVLDRVATDYGRRIGARAAGAQPPQTGRGALAAALAVLAEHGYEPCDATAAPVSVEQAEPGEVVLANCPFHALAQSQTELACGMNYALIQGLAEMFTPVAPRTRLCPGDQRCCVVLAPAEMR